MAEELQYSTRGDAKRKYDGESSPPPPIPGRRTTGFSSQSPDAGGPVAPDAAIQAAKQKAQEIAARLYSNSNVDAKRTNVENGGGYDSSETSSAPPDYGHKPTMNADYGQTKKARIPLKMTSDNGNEERKKLALNALERRFALAEDELLQQQQPKRNRPLPQHKPPQSQFTTYNYNTNTSLSSLHQNPITTLSSPNHSVKKDAETSDPIYSLLSHPVHENLVSTTVELFDIKGSVTDKILHELLRNGDAAQKYNQGLKGKKIDNWVPLENLDKGSGAYDRARIKALNKNSKRSKKHMSMKQHKKFGSLTLPNDSLNFEIYKPMHEIWKGYITQLLKNVGNNQCAQRLLSADLHGAIILIVQSKIVSFVGVSGIMIRETAETFSVITAENKLQVVPKKASVFMLQADCWKITLLGDELRSRNMGS